jgi:hypothetical protein
MIILPSAGRSGADTPNRFKIIVSSRPESTGGFRCCGDQA